MANGGGEPETWTVMVYMAGDNNLEFETVGDLAEMEAAGGSTDDVNIIALVDTLSITNGTHLLRVTDEAKIDVSTGEVNCDCEEILGAECADEELNMGDPATLQKFIEDAVAYAPADRYFLILWDHGSGLWGACWDESSIREIDGRVDRLTMDEIGNAISAAEDNAGIHLDVIAFDACLMAMIEVAYEIKDLADYLVASVTGIPFGGWAYVPFIENLTRDPGMPMDELFNHIVEGYVEEYSWCVGVGLGGWIGVGLSVIDLGAIDALAEAVDDLSYELSEGLQSGEMSRGEIAAAFKASTPGLQMYGEQCAFPDLAMAASRLAETYDSIAAEANAVVEAVEAAVLICDWVSQDDVEVFSTTGLTIYLPTSYLYTYIDYSYWTEEQAAEAGEYIYFGLDFVIDTNWDEFVLDDFCIAYVAE